MQGFGWRLLEPEAGFTLIEMLVATIIFAIMVLGFGATYMNGRLLVLNEGARRQALILAQSRLEDLKLNDFATLEGMLGDIQTNISIADIDFSRTVSVSYVEDDDYNQPAAAPPSDSLKLEVTVSDNDAEMDFTDVVLDTIIVSMG